MFVSAREFKKAPTTSICSISRSNSAARATASFQVTFLSVLLPEAFNYLSSFALQDLAISVFLSLKDKLS
jgi:hypothetical protein